MGKGTRLKAMKQQPKSKDQQPNYGDYIKDIDSWYGILGKEGAVQTVLTGDDIRSLLKHKFFVAAYTLRTDVEDPKPFYCMSGNQFTDISLPFKSGSRNISLKEITYAEEFNCRLLFLTMKADIDTPANIDKEIRYVHYLCGMFVESRVIEAGRQEDELADTYLADAIKSKLYIDGKERNLLEITI